MKFAENIKENKIIGVILLIVVFFIMETGCFLAKDYGSLMCVIHAKKDNYKTSQITDLSNYQMEGCILEDGYIIANEKEPYILVDNIKGYIGTVLLELDPSQTYCDEVSVYYDKGKGFKENNKETDILTAMKPTLLFQLNEEVETIKICFHDINENPNGESTLKINNLVVNSVPENVCEKNVRDYLIFTFIVALISYVFLIFLMKKQTISITRLAGLVIMFVVMRIQFGNGYISVVSNKVKCVMLLVNCLMAAFVILLMMKGNDRDEESEY